MDNVTLVLVSQSEPLLRDILEWARRDGLQASGVRVDNCVELMRVCGGHADAMILADYAPPVFDAVFILESLPVCAQRAPWILVGDDVTPEVWQRAEALGARRILWRPHLWMAPSILRRELNVLALHAEYERTNELLKKKAHDLGERVKELGCLYQISRLAERAGLSRERFIRELLPVIAHSWQHPSITCVRIKVRDDEFQTEDFRLTPWRQTEDITAEGCPIGRIDVCYLEKRPDADEGPFLREERELIQAIGKHIGELVARKDAESAMSRQQRLLERSQAEIRAFSTKLLAVREEEKKSIANTLHDELGSIAVWLGSRLKIAEKSALAGDTDAVVTHIGGVREMLYQSIEGLKRLAKDLRPPNFEAMGLTGAIEELIAQVSSEENLRLEFRHQRGALEGVEGELAIALYRIVQEALNNMAEHARATQADIVFSRTAAALSLTIADNGQGFEPERAARQGKIGLQGIRERVMYFGGSCRIKSEIGKGTSIKIRIPLHDRIGKP